MCAQPTVESGQGVHGPKRCRLVWDLIGCVDVSVWHQSVSCDHHWQESSFRITLCRTAWSKHHLGRRLLPHCGLSVRLQEVRRGLNKAIAIWRTARYRLHMTVLRELFFACVGSTVSVNFPRHRTLILRVEVAAVTAAVGARAEAAEKKFGDLI